MRRRLVLGLELCSRPIHIGHVLIIVVLQAAGFNTLRVSLFIVIDEQSICEHQISDLHLVFNDSIGIFQFVLFTVETQQVAINWPVDLLRTLL